MKRVTLITSVFLLIMTSMSFAQLPGDFNCSGTVNGLDWSYLINIISRDLLDTTTCTWRNGDLNGDALNHTIADWWQWELMAEGDTLVDNPPMPFEMDTIMVGDVWAAPGQFVEMPVLISLAEPALDVALHFRFDSTYFYNVRFQDDAGDLPLAFWMERGDDIYWQHIPFETIDRMPQGAYFYVYLSMYLRDDIPVDTSFTIELVAGDYYPSGFANVSYPTYFIRPVLVGGTDSCHANWYQ